MPRRKPEFRIRPNTPNGTEMGMDIDNGHTVDERTFEPIRREVTLRFVALDGDGNVDPGAETLYYCNLDLDTARAAGKELLRMAG